MLPRMPEAASEEEALQVDGTQDLLRQNMPTGGSKVSEATGQEERIMIATHKEFIGIENVKPVKILQYWGYSEAYVNAPRDREYILNPNWTAEHEMALFSPLRYRLEQLQRDASGNQNFRCDNKETYLYLTEDGREVAVLFKDCWAKFGLREDITEY
jgi:hypothetical protein